ncbi:MAG: hypothetical protein A9Z00_03150 [Thermobacillus sp. ZCTH02-B1]|uniref:DUF4129 domain-containing protein n=1 Tax=Thermobacillus sp. ZCTH02-B1 TaxID=1858795 RepID=UPI000B556F23|nr:DUF4129 domain-containing protein [Thermobacillus sp. ZCTH02-B1]OUM96606.1 MAG: hypothetical protein A9Z00_03150 [Thermobacillus sp. ZCTH02-B1]
MKAREWLLALWLGVTETVIWLPVPLFAVVWGLDAAALYGFLAALPFCYAAGERLTARWSRMRRIVRFASAAAIGIGAGLLLRPYGVAWIAAAAVASAAALRGMSPVPPDDVRQRHLLAVALAVYFIGSIAAGFMDMTAPLRLLLAAGGVLTLLLAVRRANRVTLIEANQIGGQVPRSVAVRNRLLTGSFAAAALFIAFFRHLETLWHLFVGGLNRLIAWLSRHAGEPAPREAPKEEPVDPFAGLPAPENGEPGWLMQMLEKIATGIAVLALAAIAVLLLRQLLRLPALARLIARWLAAWRERTAGADAGGYVDEVERLTGETMLSGVFRRLREIGRRESWAAMTPEERIRWLFRRRFERAGKRGFRYRPNLTPRENFEALRHFGGDYREADDALRRIYTEVRYGRRPAAKDEAERLKSDLGL